MTRYYGGGVQKGAGFYNLEANMMAAQSLAQMFQQIQAGQQRRGGQEFLSRLATAQNPQQRQQVIQTPTQGPQSWLGKIAQPFNPLGTAGGVSPTQQGYLTNMIEDQNRQKESDRRMDMSNNEWNRRTQMQTQAQIQGENRRQQTRVHDPIYQEDLKQARTPKPDPYANLTPEQKQHANEYKHGLRARPSAGEIENVPYGAGKDYAIKQKQLKALEKQIERYQDEDDEGKVSILPGKEKTVLGLSRRIKKTNDEINQGIGIETETPTPEGKQEFLSRVRVENPFWDWGGEQIQINRGTTADPDWQEMDDSYVAKFLNASISYVDEKDRADLEKITVTGTPEVQREALRRIITEGQ